MRSCKSELLHIIPRHSNSLVEAGCGRSVQGNTAECSQRYVPTDRSTARDRWTTREHSFYVPLPSRKPVSAGSVPAAARSPTSAGLCVEQKENPHIDNSDDSNRPGPTS